MSASFIPADDPRLAMLADLPLIPLLDADDDRQAGLLLCSLPVPPGAPRDLCLDGSPTWQHALGGWPEATTSPRRLLLIADAPNGLAPATVRPTAASGRDTDAAPPAGWTPPTAEMVLFESCPEADWGWDRHYLRLGWGGRSIGLALGLRTGGQLRWWEGCHLVVIEESATCRVVEMGGAIPRDLFGSADLERWPGHENPYLHRHNWLNGYLRVRLHANGVCEILARHINAKYVDDGLELADVVPVLGFRLDAMAPGDAAADAWRGPDGAFDGGDTAWQFGDVRLDMTDPARLATPEHPGQVGREDGFLVYQPYEGVELYSGIFGRQRLGDEWLVHAASHTMPKGMARTLPFTVSLNPARPPRVVRYQAPAWWFGACAEFAATPLLPVHSDWDRAGDTARNWVAEWMVRGGFEDGNLPRAARGDKEARQETSWEGELPGGLFLLAWRTGLPIDHAHAMRTSWYYSDCAVDHASRLVRMHGYSPPAVSLPMQRVHAIVTLWLDTGWPHLQQLAESVLDHAYWLHKNSWPRSATGRDACFIRGLVLLYRETGNAHFLTRARDALGDVVSTQQPDGSFRDQGGGTGIHGWGAYITKPWMNSMVAGPLLDYLEIVPGDAVLAAAYRRQIDWFMAERWFHHGANGWSYKHFCKGGRRQYSPREGGELTMPTPDFWHLNYLARMLTWAAERFGDPAYFAAFMESFLARDCSSLRSSSDHGTAQNLQYLPWTQARLWRARVTAGGATSHGVTVELAPQWFGESTPPDAVVDTPLGPMPVRWRDGKAEYDAPPGVTVTLR